MIAIVHLCQSRASLFSSKLSWLDLMCLSRICCIFKLILWIFPKTEYFFNFLAGTRILVVAPDMVQHLLLDLEVVHTAVALNWEQSTVGVKIPSCHI